MPEQKFSYYRRIIGTSVTAPAVRMVLLYVGQVGEECERCVVEKILPIVAIQSRLFETWKIPAEKYTGDPPSVWPPPSEWIFNGNLTEEDMLVVSSYTDALIPTDLVDICDESSAAKIVCCPWPYEQDEIRLKGEIDKLIAVVFEEVEWSPNLN